MFISWPAIADELSSPPFVIHHVPNDLALAERTAAVLQEGLAELQPRLPTGEEAINVVICDSLDAFARFAGGYAPSRVTGVAHSERGLIAVKAPYLAVEGAAEYNSTLRHELVHVLLDRNGYTQHMPRWLNEGLAMTLGREYRWASSLRVAEMYMQGNILSPRELQFAFASSGRELEFGDAYAQSLSLTKHLEDRLGADAFWDFVTSLKNLPFNEALAAQGIAGVDELWADWQGSLWKLAVVFSLVSGFTAFQFMALLTVWAYIRRKRRGAALMREWDEEDGDTPESGSATPDDEGEYVEQGPYRWESYYDEDEDDDRSLRR